MGEEPDSPKTKEEDDLSHLFTVDNKPTYISDEIDIPVYSSKFQVLKQKEEEEEDGPPKPARFTCWNCGGDHNMRECTERRNPAAIAQRRAESQARTSRVCRYHIDDAQKYGHFQPGKISDGLRRALGLRPDQVPMYVYRMRELGYPPGWVEEAKVSHSGLSMFDTHGAEVKDPELEDGEILAKEDRDKYDLRKIIAYPGFNAPLEPGTVDETVEYGAYPMRESQSIKHMEQLWAGKQTSAYRRKRLKVQSTSKSGEPPSECKDPISPEEEEMELDLEDGEITFLPPTDDCGFVPPLPDQSPPRRPSPPSASQTPSRSPNKNIKRKLPVEDDEASPQKKEKSGGVFEQNVSLNESVINPSKTIDSTEINKSNDCDSPASVFNGRVKSVSSGTPVICRSEFKRLPSPEKFSKNICDVINFENLPNATGKYEQMRGLVNKVRDYVSKSLSYDDEDGDEKD